VSQAFGYIPKSGIAGSNGRSMSSFLSSGGHLKDPSTCAGPWDFMQVTFPLSESVSSFPNGNQDSPVCQETC
jgi:hypothetical protein